MTPPRKAVKKVLEDKCYEGLKHVFIEHDCDCPYCAFPMKYECMECGEPKNKIS